MLKCALTLLKNHNVVAIPTETVYGLAAPISDPIAIESIFKVKERPFFDPLIVHISSLDQIQNVAQTFPPLAQKLADKFWPGPLTMILPKKENLNPMITSGLPTVGIRMPRHDLTLRLITQLGEPVAAPSANKFGRTSPTRAEHVQSEFGDSVFVLDGGPCDIGLESTVIGFDDEFKQIYIFRPGYVTTEQLAKFAPTSLKSNNITKTPTESISSPGTLEHHYQPSVPLVILSRQKNLSVDDYLHLESALKLHPLYPSWMSLPDDELLAARLLYENMRKAAALPGSNCIFLNYDFTTKNSDHGVHTAITDRLRKAATVIL